MAFKGGFGGILGPLWEHVPHMGATLGSLRGYFTISFGLVWVSVGDFGSLDGHLAMIVDLFLVYEDQFSKDTHFPDRF